MAVRTTSVAVQAICNVKSSVSLTPFIEAANAIVTKHCTDTAFTATELELIERWLSAHCYKMRELHIEQERAGPVGRSFQTYLNLGFDNSTYGQMAMRLDWSGALSALNEQAKKGAAITVGVTWLGTPYDEIDDDEELN